jgi:hypothetical protein
MNNQFNKYLNKIVLILQNLEHDIFDTTYKPLLIPMENVESINLDISKVIYFYVQYLKFKRLYPNRFNDSFNNSIVHFVNRFFNVNDINLSIDDYYLINNINDVKQLIIREKPLYLSLISSQNTSNIGLNTSLNLKFSNDIFVCLNILNKIINDNKEYQKLNINQLQLQIEDLQQTNKHIYIEALNNQQEQDKINKIFVLYHISTLFISLCVLLIMYFNINN